MKEPIKKGDYVRIKYMNWLEKIGRITQILEKDPCYKDMQMYQVDVCVQHSNGHYPAYKIYEEDIVDYNENVAELLKIGDYVNGSRIDDIFDGYIFTESSGRKVDKIITITTKEDFEKINYRLESD